MSPSLGSTPSLPADRLAGGESDPDQSILTTSSSEGSAAVAAHETGNEGSAGLPRRRRVLMIAPDPVDPGGITAILDTWTESGLNERVEVKLLPLSAWDSPVHRQVATAAVGYLRLASMVASATRRPEIVHLHISVGGSLYRKFLASLIARVARVPYVAHLHSGSFEGWVASGWLRRFVARCVFGKASTSIAPAERWIGLLRELGARDPQVVGHGLSADARARLLGARRQVNPSRAADSGKGRRSVILYYGRWSTLKGVDLIAPAVRRLSVDHAIPSELRVFGNGDRRWLATQLSALPAEHTFLGGWLDEEGKAEELCAADVVVHPARVEAFGQSLLEAMTVGVPIVASDAGAIPEVLGFYPAARIVPAGDSIALGDALAEALSQSSGSSKPCSLDHRFHAEHAVDALARIYDRIT